MSTFLSHRGLPDSIGRFDLLRDFKLIYKSAFRLSSTAFALLSHLVERTQDQDYLPDRICAYWGRVGRISEDTSLSPRSINYAARELEEKGFLVRTTGANGMRAGVRKDGKIIWAAGLNLQPWIDRWEEIGAQAHARRLRSQAVNSLRREIRSLGKQLRLSGNIIAYNAAQTIVPDNRTARIADFEKLHEIKVALQDALHALEALPVRAQLVSDASEEKCAPLIQNELKTSYCRRRALPAPLSRFTTRTIVAIASEAYCSLLPQNRKPDWQDIVDASFQISRYLGIKDHVWAKSCEMFGKEQTALCIAIIDRNHALPLKDRYHARRPSLCLEGMTRKASRGELDLARLIGPLLARMDDPIPHRHHCRM